VSVLVIPCLVAKKLQEKNTKHNLILMSSFALVKNKVLNSDLLGHTFVMDLLGEKCSDSSR
jgi:hypothetical protein